ncbi:tetratricopeptide repeat protein [Myceligenerans crystallogenes]|uniref:tetratricopeptide repeat protein n=1 Tax=Myceligenerans crystallogenes TaxID=316335 RepID=UPI0031D208F2
MLRRSGRDSRKRRELSETAPADNGPARLLDPRLRVVPFAGRDAELNDLAVWAGGSDLVKVRLLTGLGGSGKSRLAVELCARLGRRRWKSVWLGPDDDPEVVATVCRGPRVLLVIDDADSFPRLPEQLAALRDAEAGFVRVLLLARTGREWWTRLRWASDLWAQDAAQAPASVAHVGPPAQEPERVVQAAAQAFAPYLGVSAPEVVVGDLPADTEPPRYGDMHAAVLAALAGPDAQQPAKPAARQVVVDVARGYGALLDLERDRWDDTDAVVARDLLRGERRDLPDRLAELHVARTLTATPGMTEVCTAVLRPGEAFHVALFAFRLDVDPPAVPGAGRLTAALLARVSAALPDDPQLLARVLRLYPWRPIPAAEAVDLAERLLKLVPDDEPGSRTASNADPHRAPGAAELLRAEALGARARALEEAGRLADAVEPAEQAEATWQRIVRSDPPRYQVAYWRSLRDLAIVSHSMGRHRAFSAVVEQVVAAWDTAADAERVWTDPDHAWGLFALALSTGHPGSADSTRWFHDRAVGLLRRLVAQDPVAYEEQLALVQANLLVLVNQGRAADALADMRESVKIRRRLAQHRPDAFERRLAYSLSNLSHALAAVGESAEALATAQEALALRQRAVRKAAVAGRDDAIGLRYELAWSLSGVGVLLSEQGRPHEAQSVEEEALAIRRDLADDVPERYREMLATSCSNLGVTYSRLGRFGDALRLETEAVEIRRDLAASSFGYHRMYLARSLSNLGVRYSDMGRTEDALEPTQEAVAILRRLVREDRRRYLADLAASLANLGATFTDLSRAQDAVGPLHEAVGALRELAREHPNRYLPPLASALTALAVALGEQRRHVSAAASAREAVMIRDRLASVDQRRFGDDLARSVRVLAALEEALPKDGLRTDRSDTARTVRS